MKNVLVSVITITSFVLSSVALLACSDSKKETKSEKTTEVAEQSSTNKDMENLAKDLVNENQTEEKSKKEINTTNAENDGAVVEVTEANFATITKKGYVLVDFFATWCRPCMMMKPVLAEVAKENAGKLVIGVLDTDKNKGISRAFNISSIPCMILFKDGKEVKRIIGYHSKEELTKALSEYIK